MRSVKFEPKAFNHVEDWLTEDRKMFQRILRIIKECQRTPFEGIGKPEALKSKTFVSCIVLLGFSYKN